ncbi:MAG: hypothetical protein U0175_07265 [Caldilineaceae bacterium]
MSANADEETLARLAGHLVLTGYPLAAFRLSAGEQKRGLVLGFAHFSEAAIQS